MLNQKIVSVQPRTNGEWAEERRINDLLATGGRQGYDRCRYDSTVNLRESLARLAEGLPKGLGASEDIEPGGHRYVAPAKSSIQEPLAHKLPNPVPPSVKDIPEDGAGMGRGMKAGLGSLAALTALGFGAHEIAKAYDAHRAEHGDEPTHQELHERLKGGGRKKESSNWHLSGNAIQPSGQGPEFESLRESNFSQTRVYAAQEHGVGAMNNLGVLNKMAVGCGPAEPEYDSDSCMWLTIDGDGKEASFATKAAATHAMGEWVKQSQAKQPMSGKEDRQDEGLLKTAPQAKIVKAENVMKGKGYSEGYRDPYVAKLLEESAAGEALEIGKSAARLGKRVIKSGANKAVAAVKDAAHTVGATAKHNFTKVSDVSLPHTADGMARHSVSGGKTTLNTAGKAVVGTGALGVAGTGYAATRKQESDAERLAEKSAAQTREDMKNAAENAKKELGAVNSKPSFKDYKASQDGGVLRRVKDPIYDQPGRVDPERSKANLNSLRTIDDTAAGEGPYVAKPSNAGAGLAALVGLGFTAVAVKKAHDYLKEKHGEAPTHEELKAHLEGSRQQR